MSTSQLCEASKLVLIQLLIGGSKMHALESLLIFSPFACLSLTLGEDCISIYLSIFLSIYLSIYLSISIYTLESLLIFSPFACLS